MNNTSKRGKQMRKLSLAFLILSALSPMSAFAHGTAVAMTAEAVANAGEIFEKNEPASLPLFTGMKGWLDQDKIQVKVYLSSNSAIQYTCTMADVGGTHVITCTKVP
jgi:hypothetical protein